MSFCRATWRERRWCNCQSDSFAGWPNSEGCVACSARKPSAAPTVKAIAASRAKRSLIRIRREVCRRGRRPRAGQRHQMPNRLARISDPTACGSLSLASRPQRVMMSQGQAVWGGRIKFDGLQPRDRQRLPLQGVHFH